AHNPTSNLKLGAGIAPVARMRALALHVGIGTDGAASNNDLDMFEETRLAALLAKGAGGDPTALPAREALAMATRLGACAMHMDHLTGSLESGKRADLIVLDVDTLHNAPAFGRDPNGVYAQIVYASKSTDVMDVMCNGRWLMRNRQLITPDEVELRRAARVEARRIDAFLGSREVSVLQKLVAVGREVAQERLEVQVKALVASAAPPLAGGLPRRRVLPASRSAARSGERRLLRRGEVAHVVAARRAGQSRCHQRAAGPLRDQPGRHDQ